MAKAGTNALTRGLSGMIGRLLVFRNVDGQTIVQAAPGRSKSSSPAQQQLRSRFREASRYAKAQVAIPVMKAAYALAVQGRKGRRAYHAALTDFLNAPEITAVDGTGYTSHPGTRISICATDDFRVTAVHVQIYTADGRLLEEGAAVQQPNGLEWVYTAIAGNGNPVGCSVMIKAFDLPGNVKEERVVMG